MIDGEGAILRGRGANIRDGRTHFRGGELSPEPPSLQALLTGSCMVKLKFHLFDLLWVCCTTSCIAKSTTNPQQIHNFPTNPQLMDKSTTNLDMSRCCGFVMDSTANPQEIETVEYGLRLVHNKSKSCTTNPQQIDNKSTTLRQAVQLVVQQIHSKSTTIRTSGV
jgi:hypothetical protein